MFVLGLLTILQIPGWNNVPVRAHDDNARDVSERQDLITQCAFLGKQHERDNQRDFIDAELHEELIWMEAAVACDGRDETGACQSDTALKSSECTLADDNCARVAAASPTLLVCGDIDDWYSGEIEAHISKLEQQRHELAEAQVTFEAALLQWRPDSSSNQQ